MLQAEIVIIHKYHICLSSVTVRKGQGSISRGFENFSGLLFNKIYVGGNHILPVQMTV